MVNFCFGLADEVFKVLAFKKLHSYKVKRVAAKRRKLLFYNDLGRKRAFVCFHKMNWFWIYFKNVSGIVIASHFLSFNIS